MPQPHRPKLLAAVALALLLPACSSSTPTVPDVPRATIQVTIDPNPIPGVQNALTGAVTASYKVVITEASGLGGTVSFVSSTVFDPQTGLQVGLNYFDGADLLVFVGTDRVEPGGTLTVPQTTTYLLPDLRTAATLTVAVQFKDDRNNLLNSSVLVAIQGPTPAPQ